jgi:hypothetical protein
MMSPQEPSDFIAGPAFQKQRQSLSEKSLDELADWMAAVGGTPESENRRIVTAEFLRRQTVFQEEATKAAKDTAEYTKRTARFMLCSVIAIAVATIIQAVVSILVAVSRP